LRDIMAEPNYVLGVSKENWSYVKAFSGVLLIMTTTKTAMNTVGKQGIFGFGKHPKLAKFGYFKEDYWKSIQALSLAVVAVTMLKDASVSLTTAANNAKLSRIGKEFF
tara:strand:- start:11366 stop:11689 length:324 start_codon:yes stop_codon:yes gene_type:complete